MTALTAKIQQGLYDKEATLLNLRKNAINTNSIDVLDAINMRLRKAHPKIYQRLVGPLFDRIRDPKFNCYCNNPKSLEEIYRDIVNRKVPADSLTCDACWQEDLSTTWGYYGYSKKLIAKKTWESLCNSRGHDKFVG